MATFASVVFAHLICLGEGLANSISLPVSDEPCDESKVAVGPEVAHIRVYSDNQ